MSSQDHREPPLRSVCLACVKPEPLRWLWPGYVLAGKVTVLEGDPDLGKSTISLDLVARVTTGQAMPRCEAGMPAASAVLIMPEDCAADTIVPRLIAAGADRGRVELVTESAYLPSSLTGHVTEQMSEHYSHVAMDEKRAALESVLRLVSGTQSGDESRDAVPESKTADRARP